jgi:mono/diheme cytochrome c family protein
MSRALRVILKILIALVIVVGVVLGTIYFLIERRLTRQYTVSVPRVEISADPESIERGRHIAHNVSACVECHKQDLGGQVLPEGEVPPGSTLAASNLTSGEGGIGATYSDEDWVRALLHAVGPDRLPLIFMPSHDYHFTERELGSLIAYLKSLPPVNRPLPQPQIGLLMRVLTYAEGFPLVPAELIDHDEPRLAAAPPPEQLSPVEQGRRLVSAGACVACHTADFAGGGGPPPGGANITPAGLKGWTEADFIRVIRERVRPDGRELLPQMPASYAGMSDDELKAIWAFLQTVPAKTRQ